MADAMRVLLQRCLNRIKELQACEADEREVAALVQDLHAALAQQPAQGEAAALLAAYNAGHQRGHESTVEGCWSDDSAGLAVDWLSDHPEYTAPPAPSASVPDDVAKDAARYRWLRDESGPRHELFMATRTDRAGTYRVSNEMDDIIDAAMLAAPEPPR